MYIGQTKKDMKVSKKELISLFSWTERGNTLISSEEGDIRAWGHVTDDLYQEVSYSQDNYPQLGVTVIKRAPEELATDIMRYFSGWAVHICNLDGVKVEDGYVCELEEG